MRVTVTALVVRDKRTNEILDVEPLKNMYNEVTTYYYEGYVTIEEIIEYAVKLYGDHAQKAMANEISAVALGKAFSLSREAKDMPSIGNIKVSIEEKEIV